MKLRHSFLLLSILGLILPFSQLVPWVMANGLDLHHMMQELFSTRIGAFFGLDVIVSALVVVLFVVVEGRLLRVRFWWLAILSTCLVGVSCGLPLFLYLRQCALDASAKDA